MKANYLPPVIANNRLKHKKKQTKHLSILSLFFILLGFFAENTEAFDYNAKSYQDLMLVPCLYTVFEKL